jgi:hypothetical protein
LIFYPSLPLVWYAVQNGLSDRSKGCDYLTLIFVVSEGHNEVSACLTLNQDDPLTGLNSHGHYLGFGDGYSVVKLLLGKERHRASGAQQLPGKLTHFFFLSHVGLNPLQGNKRGGSKGSLPTF